LMNAGSTTGVRKSWFFLDFGLHRNDETGRFPAFYEVIMVYGQNAASNL